MTVFRRRDGWAAKFVHRGHQYWVKGSPFSTPEAAEVAEAALRRRIQAGYKSHTPDNRPRTVYVLYAGGEAVYVGITAGGIRRMGQHRRNRAWWMEVTSATFKHFDSLDKALAEESRLIHALCPSYNYVGKPLLQDEMVDPREAMA